MSLATGPAIDPAVDAHLTDFARAVGDPSQGRAPWLAKARASAYRVFQETGFPERSAEEWRFTNVEPLSRALYEIGPRVVGDAGAALAAQETALGLDSGHRLAFLNGRWAPELSRLKDLPRGVTLSGLRETLGRSGDLLEAHMGRQIAVDRHPFAALNTALWEDGACLRLAPGTVVAEPILLVFLTSTDARAMTSPRVLILAEQGSQATIVESYGPLARPSAAAGRTPPSRSERGAGRGSYFTNAVTELVLGPGAVVDHIKLQLEDTRASHIAATAARLGRDSRYSSRSVSAGGALVRNDLIAVLDGEGAECTFDGLFLAAGTQHIDNHTTIDHARPHGTSREIYKGILGGSARGVFDGKIIVRADAQKTDSRQVNRNLLLSDAALINTKPQLEINADDVKCAHAATIGRLDEASLFYLRSRGIGHHQARALLIEAFAGEVVGRIALDPLRARIGAMVHAMAVSEAGSGLGEAA